MERIYIDINCDVGEGVGNEEALMPLISSCNIACGGHAGDSDSIAKVARLANEHNVKVGAHPAYPDRKNFGRVSMDIPKSDLIQHIQKQMDDFWAVLKREDIELNHIKPHGALYNDIAKNAHLAKTFLKAIFDFKDAVPLYVPPKSRIEKEAIESGFTVIREAFVDRAYNDDSSLASRSLKGAVIQDPTKVYRQLMEMVKSHHVTTLYGNKIAIQAETYCVHGDTPSALEILNYLDRELPKANIQICR